MTAAESLLAYRRIRLGVAETAARQMYAAFMSLAPEEREGAAAEAYERIAEDRAYWRRLYAAGARRVYRQRRP